jgi:outer membrane protein assembly factor BamA
LKINLFFRNTKIFVFLLIFITFGYFKLVAQFNQDTSKKIQYLLIPVLFKTPEMGVAFGLSGSMSFKTSFKKDTLTRTSVIQTIGFFTTRKQNIQAIDAAIYFPKEKYIFLFQSSHSYFPDRFWGIGPNTKDKPWEQYSFDQFYCSPHLKKRITNRLFTGALYEFQTVFNQTYKIGSNFDTSNFVGKSKYHVSGVGLSVTYDSRNLTFWPSKGVFINSQFTHYSRFTFSDYNLLKWISDIRYFKKIYQSHILAFQFYNYRTFGNTPLKELASFGGPNNMRGFYQGRYRAKSMITLIMEYRMKIVGRFSACFFGGMGEVYSSRKDISISNLNYSYGGGLRFALLEKEMLNLRIDYGYSNRFNQAFYFTIAECF